MANEVLVDKQIVHRRQGNRRVHRRHIRLRSRLLIALDERDDPHLDVLRKRRFPMGCWSCRVTRTLRVPGGLVMMMN